MLSGVGADVSLCDPHVQDAADEDAGGDCCNTTSRISFGLRDHFDITNGLMDAYGS